MADLRVFKCNEPTLAEADADEKLGTGQMTPRIIPIVGLAAGSAGA